MAKLGSCTRGLPVSTRPRVPVQRICLARALTTRIRQGMLPSTHASEQRLRAQDLRNNPSS